jgi:hypothetical protein
VAEADGYGEAFGTPRGFTRGCGTVNFSRVGKSDGRFKTNLQGRERQ